MPPGQSLAPPPGPTASTVPPPASSAPSSPSSPSSTSKVYTVEGPGGHQVSFEWDHPAPPTEDDLHAVFHSAGIDTGAGDGLNVGTPGPAGSQHLSAVTTGQRVEAALPTAGMMIGGIAGSTLGPGAGILGAGLGGGAGRALQYFSRGVRTGNWMTSPPPAPGTPAGPPPSGWKESGQQALEIGKSAAEGAASQAVGVGAGKVVGGVVKAVGAPALPARAQDAVAMVGGPTKVTAGQAKSGPVRDLIENIGRGGILSHSLYDQADTDLAQTTQALGQRLLTQYGPGTVSRAEAGGVLQDAREAAYTAASKAVSKQYQAVFAGPAKDVTVDVTPLQARMGSLADAQGPAMDVRGGAPAKLNRVVSGLAPTDPAADAVSQVAERLGVPASTLQADPAYQKILSRVVSQYGVDPAALDRGALTFEQAHNLRSSIGQIQGLAARRGDTYTKGITAQLYGTLSHSMEQAAEGAPGVWDAYTRAAAAHAAKIDTYTTGTLAQIGKSTAPKALVSTLFGSDDPAEIKKVTDTLGEAAVTPARRALVQSLLTNKFTGQDPTQWEMNSGSAILSKLSKYSPQTVEAALPGAAKDLYRFGQALEYLQRPKSGIGKLAIQFEQAGPVLNVLMGTGLGGVVTGERKRQGASTGEALAEGAAAAGSVVLTPWLLSKVMLSAPMRQALNGGMQAAVNQNLPAVRSWTTRLVSLLEQGGLMAGQQAGLQGDGSPASSAPPAAPKSTPTTPPAPRLSGPPAAPRPGGS